jgi:hypothetical protein
LLDNGKETANVYQSGKIEVLRTEELYNGRSGIDLKKLRFFGETPDQYINLIVSQLWCQADDDSAKTFYHDKIEVDPTSPAIKDFTSLQTALNNLPPVSSIFGVCPSLVVLKAEKYSHGKKYLH